MVWISNKSLQAILCVFYKRIALQSHAWCDKVQNAKVIEIILIPRICLFHECG